MGLDQHDQDRLWEYYQNQSPDQACGGATARLAWLVGRLRGLPRVLNVGVGNGTFERLALEAGHIVSCLDPSADAVARVRAALHLGDRARAGHAQDMPFAAAAFDAVVASEVLEHLGDAVLGGALAEIARVLRPGGRFVGTVPAREDLGADTVVCPCCGARFHRWGHVQSFDAARLRALLAPRFAVARLEERIFVDWASLNWKGRVLGGVRLAAHRVGVVRRGDHLVWEAVAR